MGALIAILTGAAIDAAWMAYRTVVIVLILQWLGVLPVLPL